MAQIRWTAEAESWLREIFDYIAVDNPAAAIATVEGIYERVRVLYSHPEIGARYDIIANRDIRILLYGHYRIAYVIKPNSDIDILGVFHGALEINRYIL
jgi:plasmid stabilization system protein ParE